MRRVDARIDDDGDLLGEAAKLRGLVEPMNETRSPRSSFIPLLDSVEKRVAHMAGLAGAPVVPPLGTSFPCQSNRIIGAGRGEPSPLREQVAEGRMRGSLSD